MSERPDTPLLDTVSYPADIRALDKDAAAAARRRA